MTRYSVVVEAQRAEGEPTRRSRVEGMVKERWPKHPHTNTWVTHERAASGGGNIAVLRHVSVRFSKNVDAGAWVEGVGHSWLDAMDDVERQRKAMVPR